MHHLRRAAGTSTASHRRLLAAGEHLPATSSLPWNSLLRSHLSDSRPDLAVALYRLMRSVSSSLPDSYTLPLALRAAAAGFPLLALAIHAHAVHLRLHLHPHVSNQLLVSYAKLGRPAAARKVFEAMPVRTTLSWNALLSAYSLGSDPDAARDAFTEMSAAGAAADVVTWTVLLSAHARCGRHAEVLELFGGMHGSGCKGNAEAAAVVLSACPYAGAPALENGRVVHGYGIRKGLHGYPIVRNSMVCMYGKLGHRVDAERLFQEAGEKNVVTWNALISSYAAAGLCEEAFDVFARMHQRGEVAPNVVSWSAVIGGFASCGDMERALELFRQMQDQRLAPNVVTLATVLSACTELSALPLGREVHGHAIRAMVDRHLLVENGLVNMYARCGRVAIGRTVFDRMKSRDLISWNSMITGYGVHGLCDEALATFDDMVCARVNPDGVTFVAILSACSHSGRVSEGRRLFDRMMQYHKISPSMEHYSCMVDILGRAGLLREASELIGTMPMRPDACVWGALLNSCRIHGDAAIAEATIARVLEMEGETAGNHMMISNLYALCGMWEDSKRVRVMTRTKGLKKSPGQSWIEVKNKVFSFAAGSMLPQEAEGVHGVLEDLYREMGYAEHTTDDEAVTCTA